ncbi:hypothetical protein HMPREF0569_0240 [Micrococcus luteus SK58]|nr:hypothetical protein HMPREF0569_0240 [Micrococcus luteus SK58]
MHGGLCRRGRRGATAAPATCHASGRSEARSARHSDRSHSRWASGRCRPTSAPADRPRPVHLTRTVSGHPGRAGTVGA